MTPAFNPARLAGLSVNIGINTIILVVTAVMLFTALYRRHAFSCRGRGIFTSRAVCVAFACAVFLSVASAALAPLTSAELAQLAITAAAWASTADQSKDNAGLERVEE